MLRVLLALTFLSTFEVPPIAAQERNQFGGQFNPRPVPTPQPRPQQCQTVCSGNPQVCTTTCF